MTADAEQNQDLFWGVRGGGGNFGIVTRFTFRTHELSTLPVLACFHRLEDAPRVLARAQELMADPATSRELLRTSFLRKGQPLPWMPPDRVGLPGLTSVVEWSGDVGKGLALLERPAAELRPMASGSRTATSATSRGAPTTSAGTDWRRPAAPLLTASRTVAWADWFEGGPLFGQPIEVHQPTPPVLAMWEAVKNAPGGRRMNPMG